MPPALCPYLSPCHVPRFLSPLPSPYMTPTYDHLHTSAIQPYLLRLMSGTLSWSSFCLISRFSLLWSPSLDLSLSLSLSFSSALSTHLPVTPPQTVISLPGRDHIVNYRCGGCPVACPWSLDMHLLQHLSSEARFILSTPLCSSLLPSISLFLCLQFPRRFPAWLVRQSSISHPQLPAYLLLPFIPQHLITADPFPPTIAFCLPNLPCHLKNIPKSPLSFSSIFMTCPTRNRFILFRFSPRRSLLPRFSTLYSIYPPASSPTVTLPLSLFLPCSYPLPPLAAFISTNGYFYLHLPHLTSSHPTFFSSLCSSIPGAQFHDSHSPIFIPSILFLIHAFLPILSFPSSLVFPLFLLCPPPFFAYFLVLSRYCCCLWSWS